MISIVIPTYNRGTELRATLASISNQVFSDYEILVVDNGPSTDDTGEVVGGFAKINQNVRYLQTTLCGVTYARSIGSLLAKGDILIQMDSDVTLFDDTTLGKVRAIFDSGRTDILGVLELKTHSQVHLFLERCQGKPFEPVFFGFAGENVGRASKRFDVTTGFERLLDMPSGVYQIDLFRSCFMAYRRSVLDTLSNWDANFVTVGTKVGFREETDFLLRARREGFRIHYTNLTAILHRGAPRDPGLMQRRDKMTSTFYYAAAHAYMVSKLLVEARQARALLLWIPYQLLLGSPKNQGILRAARSLGIPHGLWALAGFCFGTCTAMTSRRRYLTLQDVEHFVLTGRNKPLPCQGYEQ